MTEERILKDWLEKADELALELGNGMSFNEYLAELVELTREAMQKARREALRDN